MEALGHHMQQEAPDELVGRQRHGFVAGWTIEPIVLVLEGDAQAAIAFSLGYWRN